MPIGPKGEKRPSDPIAAAVMVGKIATGQLEEPTPARCAGGRAGGAARATSKRPPPPLSSSPDDALGIRPRRPAVEGAVEDPEGQADAQLRHPLGGFLLLLEEGVGDEVGHL